MAGGSSVANVRQWVDRFERFRKSGQTFMAFCDAEGISQPSFYQWKKLASQTGRAHVEAASFGNSSFGKSFRAVELKPLTSSSTTTIRLPSGIEIELGNDPRVIELVLEQLLRRPAESGSGWSC